MVAQLPPPLATTCSLADPPPTNRGAGRRRTPLLSQPTDESGALLLTTLILLSLTAALGTALLASNQTAAWSESEAAKYTKAYYLAEAGGRFALPRIQELLAVGGNPATLGYAKQRFHLAEPNQSFLLDLVPDDQHNPSKYTLTSTGALAKDTVSKTINYDIVVPATIVGFKSIGYSTQKKRWRRHSATFLAPDDWTVVGGKAEIKNKTTADGQEQQILHLKTAHHWRHDSGEVVIGAGWANDMSSLPLLSELWAANDNLLSYAIQVKISLKKHDLLTGISFRLTSQAESSSGHASFYGASYLYNDARESRLPIFSPNPNFAPDSAYLILWKQYPDGSKSILQQKRLLEADGVTTDHHGALTLKPMTTLVVNLVEQFNKDAAGRFLDASGQVTEDPARYSRHNQISLYWQNAANYRPGELSWDYARFQVVTWSDGLGSSASCPNGTGKANNCLADSSLTSADFAQREPDEIGLHAYGDGDASLADFAVYFPPLRQIVQY